MKQTRKRRFAILVILLLFLVVIPLFLVGMEDSITGFFLEPEVDEPAVDDYRVPEDYSYETYDFRTDGFGDFSFEFKGELPDGQQGPLDFAVTETPDGVIEHTYGVDYLLDSYIVEIEEKSIITATSEGIDADDQKEKIRKQRDRVLGDLEERGVEFTEVVSYENVLSGMNIRTENYTAIEKLRDDPAVKDVHRDRIHRINLDHSVEQVGAPYAWNKQVEGVNLTGEDVSIAILDTGVDYTHYALGNCTEDEFVGGDCEKVPEGYDFINKDENAMDDHGHGTHVAGTAAGNGTRRGIAPGAEIFTYKVLDDEGSGPTSTIIQGVEQAVSDGADIISMSLGSFGDPDDALSTAVDEAVSSGVVAVTGAGNEGPKGPVTSPGTARDVIAVGAVDDEDNIADFSSTGPVEWNKNMITKPDLVAPGVQVCSPVLGDFGTDCGDGYGRISGTSVSTPMVSGAAAILLQQSRAKENLDYSPLDIRSLLGMGAEDLGNTSFVQGSGRLDIQKTLELPPLTVPDSPVDVGVLDPGASKAEDFSVRNYHTGAVEVELNVTEPFNYSLTGGEGGTTPRLTPENAIIDSGESSDFELEVPGSSDPGIYYGYIFMEENVSEYKRKIPYSFKVLPNSTISVDFYNEKGEKSDPRFILFYDEDGNYGPTFSHRDYDLGEFEEPMEPGKYAVWVMKRRYDNIGGGWKTPVYFILGDEIELSEHEELNVVLNASEAKKIELETVTEDGEDMWIDRTFFLVRTDFHPLYGLSIHSGNNPLKGNQTLYVSEFDEMHGVGYLATIGFYGFPIDEFSLADINDRYARDSGRAAVNKAYTNAVLFEGIENADEDKRIPFEVDREVNFDINIPYHIEKIPGRPIFSDEDPEDGSMYFEFLPWYGHGGRAFSRTNRVALPNEHTIYIGNKDMAFRVDERLHDPEDFGTQMRRRPMFSTWDGVPDLGNVSIGSPPMVPPPFTMSNNTVAWKGLMRSTDHALWLDNYRDRPHISLRDSDDNLIFDEKYNQAWWKFNASEDAGGLEDVERLYMDIDIPSLWTFQNHTTVNASFDLPDESTKTSPWITNVVSYDMGFDDEWNAVFEVENVDSISAYIREDRGWDEIETELSDGEVVMGASSINSDYIDLRVSLREESDTVNLTIYKAAFKEEELNLTSDIPEKISTTDYVEPGGNLTKGDKGIASALIEHYMGDVFLGRFSTEPRDIEGLSKGGLGFGSFEACYMGEKANYSFVWGGASHHPGTVSSNTVEFDQNLTYALYQDVDELSGHGTATLTGEVDTGCPFDVYLETNETGYWEPKEGKYGSPSKLEQGTVEFQWSNRSVGDDTVLWRLRLQDDEGNNYTTRDSDFLRTFPAYDVSTVSAVLRGEIPQINEHIGPVDAYFEYSRDRDISEFNMEPENNTDKIISDGDFYHNPGGYSHDNDWIHDNVPFGQGERRKYSYYEAGSDASLRGTLRDEPQVEATGAANSIDELTTEVIYSDIQSFGDYFEVTAEYTGDDFRFYIEDEIVATWEGLEDYDELYFSSYEWAGSFGGNSLRLIDRSEYSYSTEKKTYDEPKELNETVDGLFPSTDYIFRPVAIYQGSRVHGEYSEFQTLSGPFFEIGIVDYEDDVEEGDVLEIQYKVHNSGDGAGTQDIIFEVNGKEEGRLEGVSLEPSEEMDDTFTWDAEAGEHSASVKTEDDHDFIEVHVTEDDDGNGNGGTNGSPPPSPPAMDPSRASVETLNPEEVTYRSVVLKGEILNIEGLDEVDSYFRWRETGETDWIETDGQMFEEEDVFEESISGLEPRTDYEFSAMVSWEGGDGVGSTKTFTTGSPEPDIIDVWPGDGASDIGTNPELTVEVEHPEGYTMDVRFYDASNDDLIHEETTDGGIVTAEWSGLEYGQTYEWYATISDDWSAARTDYISFEVTTEQTEDEVKDKMEHAGGLESQLESRFEDLRETTDVSEVEGRYADVVQLLSQAEEDMDRGDYGEAMRKLEQAEPMLLSAQEELEELEEEPVAMDILLIVIALIALLAPVTYILPRKRSRTSRRNEEIPEELEMWLQKKFNEGHSRKTLKRALEKTGRDPAIVDRYLKTR